MHLESRAARCFPACGPGPQPSTRAGLQYRAVHRVIALTSRCIPPVCPIDLLRSVFSPRLSTSCHLHASTCPFCYESLQPTPTVTSRHIWSSLPSCPPPAHHFYSSQSRGYGIPGRLIIQISLKKKSRQLPSLCCFSAYIAYPSMPDEPAEQRRERTPPILALLLPSFHISLFRHPQTCTFARRPARASLLHMEAQRARSPKNGGMMS